LRDANYAVLREGKGKTEPSDTTKELLEEVKKLRDRVGTLERSKG
jgi:hypothetical protein